MGKSATALLKRAKQQGVKRAAHSIQPNTLSLVTEALDTESAAANDQLRQIPLDRLKPGRYQPRRDKSRGFKHEALEELAKSIKVNGVLQPIVVRPVADGHYEIVAGERRWRAAMIAELTNIPAVVRDVPDATALAIAIIENIQREDLSPYEEAIAVKRFKDEFSLSVRETAQSLGKTGTWISDRMRLFKLPMQVQQHVENGLPLGAALALSALPYDQQLQLADEAVEGALPVEQVRQRANAAKSRLEGNIKPIDEPATPAIPEKTAGSVDRDPNVVALETQISEYAGAPCKLGWKGEGRPITLRLTFHNLEGLQGYLEKSGIAVDD